MVDVPVLLATRARDAHEIAGSATIPAPRGRHLRFHETVTVQKLLTHESTELFVRAGRPRVGHHVIDQPHQPYLIEDDEHHDECRSMPPESRTGWCDPVAPLIEKSITHPSAELMRVEQVERKPAHARELVQQQPTTHLSWLPCRSRAGITERRARGRACGLLDCCAA